MAAGGKNWISYKREKFNLCTAAMEKIGRNKIRRMRKIEDKITTQHDTLLMYIIRIFFHCQDLKKKHNLT